MACNLAPPEGHPLHSAGVACHMRGNHLGPCSWAVEASVARRALDRLLATFPHREVVRVEVPGYHPARAAAGDGLGSPWLLVTFEGDYPLAIWRETGATYRMRGPYGPVEDDPILAALGAIGRGIEAEPILPPLAPAAWASFTCPRCQRTSDHPVDVAEGYCGACRDWTGLGR